VVVLAILLWYGGNIVCRKKQAGAPFNAYMGLTEIYSRQQKSIPKSYVCREKGNHSYRTKSSKILDEQNPITSKVDAINKEDFFDSTIIKNINSELGEGTDCTSDQASQEAAKYLY
jgi:subfamily B ATP-binding cassette protein MsbA